MNSKLIGSILLIVGTCIGAGMLALPIATAQVGFLGALLQLLCCWLVMTLSAFVILEVNLRLPQNSNLISMAGATIGPFGQVIAWITYLLLLYSLLCAYIAGGSDLLRSLFSHISGFSLTPSISTIIFTLLLGIVVYLGIRTIDYVNRGLMLIKFSTFFLLILLLASHVRSDNLVVIHFEKITTVTALFVTITSFGYSPIIPSLRIYLASNIKQLKIAILVGSLIPLICYILWDAAIMGVLPLYGESGLANILNSDNQTSSLVHTLTTTLADSKIAFFASLFTSVCMVTSFLGVSLCLTDFLADGFSLEKTNYNKLLITAITYLPPIAIVIFFPHIFIAALQNAGIICIILMVLLPAWMALLGRTRALKTKGSFVLFGGNFLLFLLILFSLAMLVWGMIGT